MAMFLGMISFLLALGLFAGALVLWHHGRPAGAGSVRAAAVVLGVGSVLTALCTGYFMVAYRAQGELDRAYPIPMMQRGMMGPGMMEEGMMGPGMMREGMMGRGMMGSGGMPGGREDSPQPEAPAPPDRE